MGFCIIMQLVLVRRRKPLGQAPPSDRLLTVHRKLRSAEQSVSSRPSFRTQLENGTWNKRCVCVCDTNFFCLPHFLFVFFFIYFLFYLKIDTQPLSLSPRWCALDRFLLVSNDTNFVSVLCVIGDSFSCLFWDAGRRRRRLSLSRLQKTSAAAVIQFQRW